ncbi:transglutaminase domain-containing protein [Flavobacterium orientale]|uniref:Transglutaminase-like domain-containing protein n=1 Tax=Flavobacterium orientale TaxID=1756020 RepID=A0A916XYY3_9FLAO|nr:transglutaminase domain-containing protein [Flavobacterium orientale]GGD20535.1 hypothetical protein GCM10011343_08800 [Flavobacterium orientale]
MRNTAIVLFFLICNTVSKAQNFDLGKVTVKELEEKEHPTEKDAEAAVLFNIGKTFFEYSGDNGFQIVTEVITKIKIYKKEGYEYANYSENYYVGGNGQEKVFFSKATTYNLVNGKIEKTKLDNQGEFIEKTNKFWSTKKITMPNVREGSIIEFKVRITSPYISNFREWEFQSGIPVNFSEYTTYIPEYFVYNSHFKGFLIPTVTKDYKTRNISYTYTEDVIPGMNTSMPERIKTNIEFREDMVKYSLTNVKPLKREAFVNNLDNYRASIVHEIAGTRFPNKPYVNFSTDWESVTQNIYKDESFGDELKKTGYFENDIDAVLQGINTDLEKVAAILNFIKKQVKWNDFNGVYCRDGVKTAYKNKTGNVAEINLMLTAMLRYAGLEANPVLVSTRSNGIPLFPSLSAFNYVIAAVEFQDGFVLLDATDANSNINILPTRVLNWEGRLIRKDGTSTFARLIPPFVSKESTLGLVTIEPDGVVNGKIRATHFDYNAYQFRNRYLNLSKESYLESLEKKYTNIEIDDYVLNNDKDLYKPVIEEYSFKHNGLTEIIGDKMYISPLLYYVISENPFKLEKRDYPIDFVYPAEDKYIITLNIPEGYVVESLPKPQVFALNNNQLTYNFSIQATGSKIQLNVVLNINQSFITPNHYEEITNFFKNVVENQSDKIVLKKS